MKFWSVEHLDFALLDWNLNCLLISIIIITIISKVQRALRALQGTWWDAGDWVGKDKDRNQTRHIYWVTRPSPTHTCTHTWAHACSYACMHTQAQPTHTFLVVFQEKLAFLHGLYQRLLAGRVLMSQQEKPFSQLSWGELTDMVYEQVANTVDALQRAEEKVRDKPNFLMDV